MSFLLSNHILAQQNNEVNWLTFEQLEEVLKVAPKKVFIEFYTDWCVYCKKMDRVAFRDKRVVEKLNKDYYVVRMNAESSDTIAFGGTTFRNKQLTKQRNPIHEIPLLLASRENYPFSLPAMVILDEEFKIIKRYFEYMDSKTLLEVL
ncbi:MAG: thioredoxin family protein [Flavobacteriaceae bacterium]|nr:thioredoxin family protein [Flavobacteriaceae bacterium]